MSQVDAVKTPATAAEVLRALLDAGAPEEAIDMLAAQSALETAGWQSMWGWNLGNITTASNAVDWQVLGSNPLHFKAYPSLDNGASDFVRYVTSHGLMPYAEAGDLLGYVAQLQKIGYAGNTDYGAYENGMRAWIVKLGGVAPAAGGMSLASGLAYAAAGVAVAAALDQGALAWLKRVARRWL
jgi:hypothetical protein